MTTPTIAELQAQQAVLQLEIDKLQLGPLTNIVNAADTPTVVNLLEVTKHEIQFLTGEAHQQAQNIITVLENCPKFLKTVRDSIDSRVNPTAPLEDPAPTE